MTEIIVEPSDFASIYYDKLTDQYVVEEALFIFDSRQLNSHTDINCVDDNITLIINFPNQIFCDVLGEPRYLSVRVPQAEPIIKTCYPKNILVREKDGNIVECMLSADNSNGRRIYNMANNRENIESNKRFSVKSINSNSVNIAHQKGNSITK